MSATLTTTDKNGYQKLYLECLCGTPEHLLQAVLDKDDESWNDDINYGGICFYIQLIQYRTFWKRFWTGLKYMFGFQERYGYWDCADLTPEGVEKLRDMCDEAIKIRRAKTQQEYEI